MDAKDKDKSLANVLFCRHGVKRGQVLRGRPESTGAPLATKNDGTRAELQGWRPQVWESPIPQEVSMCPTSVSTADGCWHRFRTGPSVCSPVHQQNAAGVPRRPKSFMLASMTAFQGKDGSVRSGIPTSTSFRRLVAKKLARQFGHVVDATCSPFQFAFSTRADTNCVEHAALLSTDVKTEATGTTCPEFVFALWSPYLQLSCYRLVGGMISSIVKEAIRGTLPFLFLLSNALALLKESLVSSEHLPVRFSA